MTRQTKAWLHKEPFIVVDIETFGTGIKSGPEKIPKFYRHDILGIGFYGVSTKNTYYINLKAGISDTDMTFLHKVFQRDDSVFIFHNAPFDIPFLYNQDIAPKKLVNIEDTKNMAGILLPGRKSYGLKILGEDILGEVHEEAAEVKEHMHELETVNEDLLMKYCLRDCEITGLLYKKFTEDFLEGEASDRKIYDLEKKLQPVIIDMMYRGHKIDVEALVEGGKALQIRIDTGREYVKIKILH